MKDSRPVRQGGVIMSGGSGITSRRGLFAAAGAALLASATACSGAGDTQALGEPGDGQQTTLKVFAAASLQDPFEEIGAEAEAAHEGVEGDCGFALDLCCDHVLATQLLARAPADVLPSADTANMDKLADSPLSAAAPVAFTSNTLMIAVPAGNPAAVTDLASLTEEDVALVLCAPAVPCGAATQEVASASGLGFDPVSQEQSVTDVLGKVSTGEADAGLVYVTDVQKAGEAVEGIEFPEAVDAVNTYPITTVRGADNAALGQEFIDLVLDETGQDILSAHGFMRL